MAAVDLAHRLRDLLRFADVAGERGRLPACGANLGCDGFAALELAAGGDDHRAVARELERDCTADAPARAGDESDATAQVETVIRHVRSLEDGSHPLGTVPFSEGKGG